MEKHLYDESGWRVQEPTLKADDNSDVNYTRGIKTERKIHFIVFS